MKQVLDPCLSGNLKFIFQLTGFPSRLQSFVSVTKLIVISVLGRVSCSWAVIFCLVVTYYLIS